MRGFESGHSRLVTLVIADESRQITFASKVGIEMIELGDSKYELKTLQDGKEPMTLREAEFFLDPATLSEQIMGRYDRIQRGNRAGYVYQGLDEDGNIQFWYLGSAADRFLLETARRERLDHSVL